MGTWGGRRPGAGRKPQSDRLRAVTGTHKRGTVLQHPSAPPATPSGSAVMEFDPPETLAAAVREVWLQLAPEAFRQGTLTRASAFAFELLCSSIVRMRALEASPKTSGGPYHRGMIREVNTRLLQFSLAPCGKPMGDAVPSAPPAANPLAKFRKSS